MVAHWMVQELERVPVASQRGGPAPALRLALDPALAAADDLDDLAGRIRTSIGSAAGEAMLEELEGRVLQAGAGRWTRADLAGWTITTLVHFLAERLGAAEAVAQLTALIEHAG